AQRPQTGARCRPRPPHPRTCFTRTGDGRGSGDSASPRPSPGPPPRTPCSGAPVSRRVLAGVEAVEQQRREGRAGRQAEPHGPQHAVVGRADQEADRGGGERAPERGVHLALHPGRQPLHGQVQHDEREGGEEPEEQVPPGDGPAVAPVGGGPVAVDQTEDDGQCEPGEPVRRRGEAVGRAGPLVPYPGPGCRVSHESTPLSSPPPTRAHRPGPAGKSADTVRRGSAPRGDAGRPRPPARAAAVTVLPWVIDGGRRACPEPCCCWRPRRWAGDGWWTPRPCSPSWRPCRRRCCPPPAPAP